MEHIDMHAVDASMSDFNSLDVEKMKSANDCTVETV